MAGKQPLWITFFSLWYFMATVDREYSHSKPKLIIIITLLGPIRFRPANRHAGYSVSCTGKENTGEKNNNKKRKKKNNRLGRNVAAGPRKAVISPVYV